MADSNITSVCTDMQDRAARDSGVIANRCHNNNKSRGNNESLVHATTTTTINSRLTPPRRKKRSRERSSTGAALEASQGHDEEPWWLDDVDDSTSEKDNAARKAAGGNVQGQVGKQPDGAAKLQRIRQELQQLPVQQMYPQLVEETMVSPFVCLLVGWLVAWVACLLVDSSVRSFFFNRRSCSAGSASSRRLYSLVSPSITDARAASPRSSTKRHQ